MKKLLTFSPTKRMSVYEALTDPYLFDFHNPAYEPTCDKVIKIAINDNIKGKVKEYQSALEKELGKAKEA